MAAENVIEVLIVGVDKLSPEAQKAIGTLKGLSGATSAVTGETVKATGATTRFHAGLSPLRTLLIQTTGATGGFGTALFNLIRFGFTPLGVAITAATAGITAVVSSWREAKETAEKMAEATQALAERIALANVEYRAMVGSIGESDAAVQVFLLSQAKTITELTEKVDKLRGSWLQWLLGLRGLVTGQTPMEKLGLGGKGALAQPEEDLKKFMEGIETARKQIKKTTEEKRAIPIREEILELRRQEVFEAVKAADLLEQELSDPSFANNIGEAVRAGLEEANKEVLKSLSETTFAWEEELLEDVDETYSKIRDIIKKDNEEIAKNAEETAADMAKSFTDRILDGLEGGKVDILSSIRALGRAVVADFLQEIIKMQLLGPVAAQLRAGGRPPSTVGGFFARAILGLFGSGETVISGEYGRGGILSGNFMPANTLRTFQTGGITTGPTVGVVGEREPELVAPVRSVLNAIRDRGTTTVVIQGDVTPRPGIKPQDVILIVADDMERGGKTARASINLQKRR